MTWVIIVDPLMDKFNKLEEIYNQLIITLEKKMLRNKEDILKLLDQMENISLSLYKD